MAPATPGSTPDSFEAEDPSGEGRLIAGRYRLVERIGAGAMGTVWHAFDELLRVDVAVKEIRFAPGMPSAEQAARAEAALREARNAARLRASPHVVTVHDAVVDGGLPWIVMDLVPAVSLETAVQRSGPLPPAEAARVGLAVLDALVAGQRIGLLHRDVKPSNILLADDGRVLLTDFGIATHVADTTVGWSRGAGTPVGTPAYMAPERASEQPATLAADLFSLGATLYFAVSGSSPFRRDTVAATIAAVLVADPPPLPAAGPLWPVIGALLIKDPKARLGADGARALLLRVTTGGSSRAAARAVPAEPRRSSPPASADTGSAGTEAAEAEPAAAAPSGATSADAAPPDAVSAEAAPGEAVPAEVGPAEVGPAEVVPAGPVLLSDHTLGPPREGAAPGSPGAVGRPRLLVAFGALALLVLVAVAAGLLWARRDGGQATSNTAASDAGAAPPGPGELPAGMPGAWSGVITQGPVTFPAEIVLRGGPVGAVVGTSEYPTEGCAADLLLLEVDGARATVQERLTRASPLCRGADRLSLTLRPDGRLAYSYAATEINSAGTGLLTRTGG